MVDLTPQWPGSCFKKKKLNMVGFWIFGDTSQSTLRIQNFKMGPLGDFEKKHFF